MATVRFDNREIDCIPLRRNDDGSVVMISNQHAARLTVGTEFLAKPSEIVAMDESELSSPVMPKPSPKSWASLEAAMAEERKTLPSPVDIIAKLQAEKVPQRLAEASAAAGESAIPFSR
jgi:hypothetical protein